MWPSRQTRLRLWIRALALLLFAAAVPCRGQEIEARWDGVVRASAEAHAAVKAYQMRYEVDEVFHDRLMRIAGVDGPVGSIHRKVSVVAHGERFREKSTMVPSTGPTTQPTSSTFTAVAASDGERVWMRDSNWSGHLMTAAVGKLPARHVPDPQDILRFWSVADTDAMLGDGKYKLVGASVEKLDDKPVVKVQFEHTATRYAVACWYSTDEGFVMVRGEGRDPAGQLVDLIEVATVSRLGDRAGRVHFFYPTSGTRTSFVKGIVAHKRTVKVALDSAAFNRTPDPALFTIAPLPTEAVYDVGLQAEVRPAREARHGAAERSPLPPPPTHHHPDVN